MIKATLFAGRGTLALDAAYDTPGPIRLSGPEPLVQSFADWLESAVGFQGHLVGYPEASPRDLHAALLQHGERWRVSGIEVDDARPPAPLPQGAVS